MRYLEKIKMKMKLEHSFYVEPIGLAGGLSLWWIKGDSEWICTFIYGPPYKDQKEFWEFMKNLRNDHGDKWLVIGDSNVVSSQDEKNGRCSFTWSNQRSDDEAILEKLDRVLCSPNWNILFPKVVAMLDIAMGSDYAPVIIHLHGLNKNCKKEFKFESKWLLEEDCTSTIQGSWESISQPRNSHRFGSKLRRTKFTLLRWSKLKDHVKNQRKIELHRRIEHYQGNN
ncbi:hypothetical protein V6N11_056525 [Hibiscus sabdariffa]|uniref:RNA-directed DNA polymerase, eukaryota, Reverse transcriptase zinc-binding domain protein n=1 Tax=Hibiscus sabdariffa TaxID=183260 RepID=A0ABR2T437_9ROSI